MKPTHAPLRTALRRLLIPAVSLVFSLDVSAQGSTSPSLGIDVDHNQISDLFEAMYPGSGTAAADNDSDGMTNLGEAAAGTNPNSSADNLNFISVTNTGLSVDGTFRSVAGKVYQLQGATSPAGPWTNEGSAIQGDGTILNTATPPAGVRMFLRIQVTDVDTDADGVTDWEELQAGTNRYLWDTDGDGFSDRSYVEALLAGSRTVNIFAADAAAEEGGTASFRITRNGGFLPLTIPYTTTGTAGAGDYNLAPLNSIVLPAGVTSGLITMTALPDALTEIAETVILTIQAGPGYSLGANTSATATIVTPGITGEYFNASGTLTVLPAVDPVNFTGPAALTRTDPTIDFDWLGVAPPPLTNDDAWVARWQGFVIPKYSEIYQIHAIADRGVLVYVSPIPITGVAGQIRINQPTTTNPTTKYSANALTGTAPMVAGQLYHLRVEYRDSATNPNNSNIQIRWSSPSQPEEVIPTGNLTSDSPGGGIPVITSSLIVAGITGAPFSYQITATNSPTTFTASGLPAGLSVNAAGLVSGVATGAGGYYFATITASNAGGTGSANLIVYLHATGGSITREIWNGVTGTGFTAIPLHTAPSSTSSLTSLEAPDNTGDSYGERLRGYLTAPLSGLYTFFLTSDENAEFWVSSGEDPGHKLKRSWVAAGSVADGIWDAQPGQRSITMRMVAGRRYYMEAVRLETTGDDHLAIAWLKPGQTDPAQKEIIPGWALTTYSPPAAGGTNGTLYAANLTPQAGANTLGSGVALLLVNPEKTGAALSYTYTNLTGPVNSGAHIHDSRLIINQTGRIIYDVDDFPADAYGNHPWDFTDPPLFSHTLADIVAAIEGGFAYLNLHTTAYPQGEIKGLFYPVSGSQFFVPPAPPTTPAELTIPSDPTSAQNEIVRFLQQATLGARRDTDGAAPWDPDSIESVQALGYAAWIDAQLTMSPGTDPEVLNLVQQPPVIVYPLPTNGRQTPNIFSNAYNGSGPLASFLNDYYQRYPRTSTDVNNQTQSSEEIWRSWWAMSVRSQDQLRHRMAFALSQILVVSEDGELDENARAMTHYYDLLYYHGFGNFRTLLEKVTLCPTMGQYLDMLGNRKPNLTTGYIPNENYAREILQLFSVGLNRLHPDGSRVLSTAGLPLTTYEQDNVVGFAHTFTGWNFPASTNNYVTPMTPRTGDHDTGEKLLLESAVVPAFASPTAASCNADLAAALNVIFHHPNVGPFISRELIQRMVTANPTPGYIYRVSSVFDNDGTGVRGNLGAVVKTILLDPEARNQLPRALAGFGHLKEPVIRATQILRAFKPFSYSEAFFGNTIDLGNCIVATQANIDLTLPLPTTDIDVGTATTPAIRPYTIVDGYVLGGVDGASTPFGVGNTLLVRNQTNAAENGIYAFNGNGQLLTRAAKADTGAEVTMAYVRVTAGTNTGVTYRQTSSVGAIGTDPQTWDAQATSNTRRHMWEMGTTGAFFQTPLRSPTVFNFYEPDYVFLGNTGSNGLYGPEFQITSETSVINTGNWFYELTRHNTAQSTPFTYGQGYNHGSGLGRDIKLDVSSALSAAADGGALVDHIAGLTMPGQIPATSRLRSLLSTYLSGLPLTGTTVLLPAASTWKYFTDSAGLGASDIVVGNATYSATNWKHPDFNDTTWSSGLAPLGYRTATTPANLNIATVLPYGGVDATKWRSSYYRTEFNIASTATVPSVTIRLKRDDGAVVYINGREAWRQNFTAGLVVSGTTLATGAGDDGAAFFTTSIPTTFLANGRNVVAVEVHQNSNTSTDVVFDLELNYPNLSTTDRMSRIGEAFYLISLSPEFATQK